MLSRAAALTGKFQKDCAKESYTTMTPGAILPTFKIVLTTTEVMTMTTTATMEEVLRRLAMEEVLRQGRLRQGMTMAPLHRHHRHHRRPAVMIAMVMGAKNLWQD
jgi:hypothetical protein